jgi:hypothetical protein
LIFFLAFLKILVSEIEQHSNTQKITEKVNGKEDEHTNINNTNHHADNSDNNNNHNQKTKEKQTRSKTTKWVTFDERYTQRWRLRVLKSSVAKYLLFGDSKVCCNCCLLTVDFLVVRVVAYLLCRFPCCVRCCLLLCRFPCCSLCCLTCVG